MSLTKEQEMDLLRELMANMRGDYSGKSSNLLEDTPTYKGKLGEMVMQDRSQDMMIPLDPSHKMAMSKVGESMGNVEQLGKASANLAGGDSVESVDTSSVDYPDGGASTLAGAASGVNPWATGGKMLLGAMIAKSKSNQAYAEAKNKARNEAKSSVSRSLANLAQIGSTLGLGRA